MSQSIKYNITNIEAARSQLKTAIMLWFNGGDAVSIHTLACASHEIIDGLSKKTRNRDLLFDSLICKDEHRREFNDWLRKPQNFFKHPSRDRKEDTIVEFSPNLTEMFILYSLVGLQLTGKQLDPEESVFLFWFIYHKPQFLTDEGREQFIENTPIEDVAQIRQLPKDIFFTAFITGRRRLLAS